MAIITTPPAEATLTGVKTDDRTTRGLFLPHEENSAPIDVRRHRASLIILDGIISGLPTTISDAFADLVGSAPATMDTLQEISSALKNNPAVIDEILAALGLRATKTEVASAISDLQTTLQAAIDGKASSISLGLVADRVTALETAFPSRARLIARSIAYSGVR